MNGDLDRQMLDRLHGIQAVDKLVMEAWGIIANAWGGDWSQASVQWREAAERWRDKWVHLEPNRAEKDQAEMDK